MKITEIRIKLMDDSEDRLRAFCSITFDHCFVIRDLKIIEGNNGPFVAMPSRKLTSHCHSCRYKNHLRARYCNQCGKKLPGDQVGFDQQGRAKLYADVAHPINAECREIIQAEVVSEFEAELKRAESPDYVSKYDEAYEFDAEKLGTGLIERVDEQDTAVSGPHKLAEETVDQFDETQDLPAKSEKFEEILNESEDRRYKKDEGFGQGVFD